MRPYFNSFRRQELHIYQYSPLLFITSTYSLGILLGHIRNFTRLLINQPQPRLFHLPPHLPPITSRFPLLQQPPLQLPQPLIIQARLLQLYTFTPHDIDRLNGLIVLLIAQAESNHVGNDATELGDCVGDDGDVGHVGQDLLEFGNGVGWGDGVV